MFAGDLRTGEGGERSCGTDAFYIGDYNEGALISVRAPECGDDVPIFCSYEGRPLNRHTWGDRIEIYCKKIGTHIRPYDLRHVFALEFLRNGANAFATQRTLGHATMEMTQRYVAIVNSDLKRSTRRPVRSIG
ncbi:MULTISPECIES: tyrosine-type recombinase/integrase [Paenibacillus]|uniref:tyrosine-type recombinase/integrase n=1 Tax=Paenibacillus TaxID=44249 RepID=UPI00290CA60F|nr:tyrosine-type recombinase/integrase [Paenibacillus polymyxa]MDU8671995.1 tyrosine-type recombinase/integrase [Paenibacillus polymyxa]MDU8696904.1 tyrosine-type recombinase/integrase [Paenibacillus polymyxa]